MYISTISNQCNILTRLSCSILNPKENFYLNVINNLVKECKNCDDKTG